MWWCDGDILADRLTQGDSLAILRAMKKKITADRIMAVEAKSPLVDELYPEWEDEEEMEMGLELNDPADESMVISGELSLGGNPVTIVVIDEVTGMEMEINHVRNGLIAIDDQRKSSSGWLSMVVGDADKVGEILRFVAKATVAELKRMMKK